MLPGDPYLPPGFSEHSGYDAAEVCPRCDGTGADRLCAKCGCKVTREMADAWRCFGCDTELEFDQCAECDGEGFLKTKEELRNEWLEDRYDDER